MFVCACPACSVVKSFLQVPFAFKLALSHPGLHLSHPKPFDSSIPNFFRALMSPDHIVRFTAAISISLAFLEPAHPSPNMAQTIQEERILTFDKIITGSRAILQACGQPKFLTSIYELWHQASQSLFILERMLWPEQPAETPLHLILPQESRPLTEIVLDAFDEHHEAILQAIPALEAFQTWFTQGYDTNLHKDFNAVLIDALLLFRSVEVLIRMKRRFRAIAPRASFTGPIDLDAEDEHPPANDDAPQAAAASSSTGTTLEFY